MSQPSLATIREIVQHTSVMIKPTVSFLAEGHGNYNYLLEENGRKLVLRIKKSHEAQFADSLAKEYILLRYLHAAGIDFCPKAIHYDKEHQVLIESFLEGEEIPLANLTDVQLEEYAACLYRIFSTNTHDLADFCKQEGFPDLPVVSNLSENVIIYGYNRLEATESGRREIDVDMVTWLYERLEENLTLAKKIVPHEHIGVSVGDLQSAVIISVNGNIQLYDFEHAKYTYSVGFSYLKIHSGLTPEQYVTLIAAYSQHSNISKSELEKYTLLEMRITLINDVVWAAMQWAQTGEECYKALIYKRKHIAEQFLLDTIKAF